MTTRYNETLVQRKNHRLVVYGLVHFLKNIVETFGLLLGGAENIIGVPCFPILVQVFDQQVELFIKSRLGFGVELYFAALNLIRGLNRSSNLHTYKIL